MTNSLACRHADPDPPERRAFKTTQLCVLFVAGAFTFPADIPPLIL
jgi:hypothetical protein